jgi:tRNA(Ile)-lysidine synthase
MPQLSERLLKTMRKQALVYAGDRVAVAVSGGADSVALLLLLLELREELGIVLSVAHVNHKLRGRESDGDERFVRDLAAKHGLEFSCETAVVRERSGIESAARRRRYEFFARLLNDSKVTKIATAHTLDDQAETVLLRLFRGTGIRGLGGIHRRLRLTNDHRTSSEVVRPLLGFRRAELREYLRECEQDWREDSSNQDEMFTRNRLRGRLLPLIVEDFGDSALEHLAELAEIARAEEELGTKCEVPNCKLTEGKVATDRLLAQPLAVQRRAVKTWIENNVPQPRISFSLIASILELAQGGTRHEIDVPSGASDAGGDLGDQELSADNREKEKLEKGNRWRIRTGPKELRIDVVPDAPADYQYRLSVPGKVYLSELNVTITAEIANVESMTETERPGLLDATRVGKELTIRNWRAGDRYWPAHTKQGKKIKELLNDKHITGSDKKLWPVVVSGEEIVWMRGFAAPETLRARNGKGIWIREIPDSHD